MIVTASRAAWAAKQASLDTQEKLGEAAESLSSTLGTIDDDGGQVYRDPSDPTKVGFVVGTCQGSVPVIFLAMEDPSISPCISSARQFFQNNQAQENRQDMITFAMIALAMYAVFQGFSTVIKL